MSSGSIKLGQCLSCSDLGLPIEASGSAPQVLEDSNAMGSAVEVNKQPLLTLEELQVEIDKKQHARDNTWRRWMKVSDKLTSSDWTMEDGMRKVTRDFAARNRAKNGEGTNIPGQGGNDLGEGNVLLEFKSFSQHVAEEKMKEAKEKAEQLHLLDEDDGLSDKPPAPKSVTDARFANCRQYEKQLTDSLDSAKQINIVEDAFVGGEKARSTEASRVLPGHACALPLMPIVACCSCWWWRFRSLPRLTSSSSKRTTRRRSRGTARWSSPSSRAASTGCTSRCRPPSRQSR